MMNDYEPNKRSGPWPEPPDEHRNKADEGMWYLFGGPTKWAMEKASKVHPLVGLLISSLFAGLWGMFLVWILR